MKPSSEAQGPGVGVEYGAGQAAAADQLPRTPAERYLAALWAEIIGVDPAAVLLSQTFLSLGGNSLTLNIVLTRIETEKGVTVPAEQFVDEENGTLAALAGELDAALEKKAAGKVAAHE